MTFLESAIYEAEMMGEISSNMRDELLAVYTEAEDSRGLILKEKLNLVKNTDSSEFGEAIAIKKFIDSNYNRIVETIMLAAKSHANLTGSAINIAVGLCTSIIACISSALLSCLGMMIPALVVSAIGLLLAIATFIYRACKFQKNIDEFETYRGQLLKIRDALKTMSKKNMLPSCRKKIVTLMMGIDAVENLYQGNRDKSLEKGMKFAIMHDGNQTYTGESVNEIKLSIYESHASGLIDDIERDILLEKLEKI